MKRLTILLLGSALAAPLSLAAQHEGHAAAPGRAGAAPELGSVHFPNSGAAAAQEPFLRGMALLHSFEYEDAAEAFRQAQRADQGFALAYWAEALTHSRILWLRENLPPAHAVLGRLGPTPAARLARARTAGERAFGEAVEAMYAEGDQPARVRAFADAARRWAAAMPRDHEAQAFAALGALWQEILSQGEGAPALRAEAAAYAQRVFDANPRHPGAAHYLIHAYDAPATALQGLAAARVYAEIAPDAEHALHMPSHIFLPLGMWDDMAASNERAWAASRAWAARGGRPGWEADWHSLKWLQYAYLQQGRWREARALLDTARALAEPARLDPGTSGAGAVSALEELAFRYAADTGGWDVWPPDLVAVDWRDPALSPRAALTALYSVYRRAAAAVHVRGDTLAALAAARSLRHPPVDGPRRTDAVRLATLLESMVHQARGDFAGALALLDTLPADGNVSGFTSMAPPSTIPPAEERAAALLRAGRAREAVAVYERALATSPNRAAALLGLARARAAAGDRAGAREAYVRLAEVWRHADADLPVLEEVRRGPGDDVARPPPSARS